MPKPSTEIAAFKPCTEARYDEFLNILPPALWIDKGFLVGEAWTHRECAVSGKFIPAFAAFAKVDGQHYEADAPMTGPEFRALTRADIVPVRPVIGDRQSTAPSPSRG